MEFPELHIKTVFSVDGQVFEDQKTAEKYRQDLLRERLSRYHRVSQETAPFNGVAIWAIYDEGPINIGDLPARVLQYVRGTREQAIRHAIKLPAFWGYGPGRVEKIAVEDL